MGKNIIIAGASSGIGKKLSIEIAKLGGNSILVGRNEANLISTLDCLQNINQSHKYYVCDFSNFSKTIDTFDQISLEAKEISGLVWCAGSELVKLTKLIEEDDIKNTFAVVYNGIIGASKSLSKKNFWSRSGGSMILISSVSAIRSNEGMLLYSTAKSAMSGITKSLAIELSKNKVRVNSLILGAVKTAMHERITKFLTSDSISDYENKHLLGFGNISDILPMIIFLLSDASRWMTGSEIVLDGGFNSK